MRLPVNESLVGLGELKQAVISNLPSEYVFVLPIGTEITVLVGLPDEVCTLTMTLRWDGIRWNAAANTPTLQNRLHRDDLPAN